VDGVIQDNIAHIPMQQYLLDYYRHTFYALQMSVIQYIKPINSNMKNIFYFSNGAASQYKNRNKFANLVNHINYFGNAAKWHFFAMFHFKTPYNAITKWQSGQSKSLTSLMIIKY
jgi:hypothetical protein